MSAFHRRVDLEAQNGLQEPRQGIVSATTLDAYCLTKQIKRINFLKIDTEGSELDVLKGSHQLLQHGHIDYIQFKYGGTYKDAGITLGEVYTLLESYRYGIFRITPEGLEYLPVFGPHQETYAFSNFLAVNERFLSTVLGLPPRMLNLRQQCVKHRITPRGVIHIGAHEGSELKTYLDMGIQQVVFIEANPDIYQKLSANVKEVPGVIAVHCAISDQNGTVDLRVTSMDQSSSILPLKDHQKIYPGIHEVRLVTVPSRTIDSLLAELDLDPAGYNLMNIDIQGAELLALKGATNTLKHIDAINTEVNYEELYEGCVFIDELDRYLDTFGFERKATTTPHHPSWGDALFVKRPLITMSTLGSNGRFGNQVFQYAFLRIFARQHGYELETSDWIGQWLFDHHDPAVTRQLPLVKEKSNILSEALIPASQESFRYSDFVGFFQYHTSYYAPHRDFFHSLFRPAPALETTMNAAVQKLRALGKTVVGLHLRRGDYGYDYFFVTPNQWYLDWLQKIWPTLEEPVLFIASDEPDKVLADFADYRPITSQSLGITLAGADYFPDFYLLSRCDLVAISNSSFSFAASMLNAEGRLFLRPDLTQKKLIEFDPWNDEVILRNAVVETSHNIEAADTRRAIVFVNNYYPAFLHYLYEKKFPRFAEQPYAVQHQHLIDELFGDSDFYSHNIRGAGWRAHDIVMNAAPAQMAWARDRGLSGQMWDILFEQIAQLKADVLYIQDMHAFPADFLKRIRSVVRRIVGQIASPIAPGTPLELYDLIISSFPHFVDRFSTMGIRSVYQLLSFEPRVLSHIPRCEYSERPIPCSFVGGISPLHHKGNQMLEALIASSPLQIWGYGRQSLPLDSPIHGRHHGEAWGRSMYEIMASSRITINRHIDVAENYANNLRLYEATGCGALLITDYRDNLNDLFEIGKEIVAYRSAEECAELIDHYINHPAEAETIAAAGQRRTLRDHTYAHRMHRLGSLLELYLQ
ncbi:hypothetical protein GSbR_13200 [Geobacter sp. SVR]|nr:hypothetical protein GSVR_42650 [Geobacter sp. SVR]GCF84720.1 hypothetical protein GSbR_13200 [Geobacter sp. SVR]